MPKDSDKRVEALGKLMEVSGVRRVTPEMTTVFGKLEVIALGMGGYFGFLGFFVALIAFFGVFYVSGELIRIFTPREELTKLEEVLEVEREAPVNVWVHVDFEEGVKVWKVKGRYFVAPVKGFEDRLFFFREESYAEGEGTTHPIKVKGRAVARTSFGWDLPTTAADDIQARFTGVEKVLPDDALILFEEDEPSVGQKFWLLGIFVVFGLVVFRLVYRILETLSMLRSRKVLARRLNKLAGLENRAGAPELR